MSDSVEESQGVGFWQQISLRQKLVSGALVVVGICTLAGSIIFLYTLGQVSETDIDVIARNSTATANQMIVDIQRRVVGYAKILARRPEIEIAISGGNIEVLEGLLVQEYQELKEMDTSVASVEAISSTGAVLMRGQNPSASGGNVSEDGAFIKARSGETGQGLSVLGDQNNIAQIATAPVKFGPIVVGALTVGSFLGEDTAQYIKEKTGAEIIFYIGSTARASTIESVPLNEQVLPSDISDKVKESGTCYETQTLGGSSYQVGYVPLYDTEGENLITTMAVLNSRQFVEEARTKFFLIYFFVIAFITAIIGWVTFIFSRRLANPLVILSSLGNEIAAGDLRPKDLGVKTHDEIGRSVLGMTNAVERIRSAIRAITEHAASLSDSSREQSKISQQMRKDAEATSSQAALVSTTAEEMSQNMGTAAIAVEEMNASIKESARNATDAASVAQKAVELADRTTATINKLGVSSSEIDQVVKLITSIASQTNLLALNATIEAARAGEAGKGFAVVANEVKELARQTETATKEIEERIGGIQADSKEAVEAIAQIGDTIKKISDIQNTIASVVEQQTATTAEIKTSVSEAAKGSRAIAENIVEVAQAAERTSGSSAATLRAATDLAGLAEELQDLVSQFRT
jgi:methyl-accepting chemotaxis protein